MDGGCWGGSLTASPLFLVNGKLHDPDRTSRRRDDPWPYRLGPSEVCEHKWVSWLLERKSGKT